LNHALPRFGHGDGGASGKEDRLLPRTQTGWEVQKVSLHQNNLRGRKGSTFLIFCSTLALEFCRLRSAEEQCDFLPFGHRSAFGGARFWRHSCDTRRVAPRPPWMMGNAKALSEWTRGPVCR